MRWPRIFALYRSKNEEAAKKALEQANWARSVLNLMVDAYSRGNSICFKMLRQFNVGMTYPIDQQGGEGDPLNLTPTESTHKTIGISCEYPPNGKHCEHYHPDCDEAVVVDEGTLTIGTKDISGISYRTLGPGDSFIIPEGVLHNAAAGGLGCKFRVIFERK